MQGQWEEDTQLDRDTSRFQLGKNENILFPSSSYLSPIRFLPPCRLLLVWFKFSARKRILSNFLKLPQCTAVKFDSIAPYTLSLNSGEDQSDSPVSYSVDTYPIIWVAAINQAIPLEFSYVCKPGDEGLHLEFFSSVDVMSVLKLQAKAGLLPRKHGPSAGANLGDPFCACRLGQLLPGSTREEPIGISILEDTCAFGRFLDTPLLKPTCLLWF